jgi:hypothetical protein
MQASSSIYPHQPYELNMDMGETCHLFNFTIATTICLMANQALNINTNMLMPSYIIIQQAKYPLGNGFHPFFKKVTYPYSTLLFITHNFFLFLFSTFSFFVMKYVIIFFYHVTLDHMGHEKSMTMQHLNISQG